MKKTKIICTLGPATDQEHVLDDLIKRGMDVARFNFSHGTHEEHLNRLKQLKELREQYGLPIAALLDTRGPEIRIGTFFSGKASLKKGQEFILCTEPIEGNDHQVFINYKELPKDVKKGMTILIDDGLISMTVLETGGNRILCRVLNGGDISDHKGINVPKACLSMPFISESDKEDLIFGAKAGFDFVAASFTRTAQDIREIRSLLSMHQGGHMKIIAKIENAQGVEHIDEIIAAADGIMIARGDMGVEIALEEVPVIQKKLINKCLKAGKQVITATQMLDSMMKNPRPTRAEATDVANAIYEGTSAIMLSGETAAGLYPVEALDTMVKIAVRAEQDIDYRRQFRKMDRVEEPDIADAISHATCTTAYDLNAAGIITVTKSGTTARMISRYRPACPIIGCATDPIICRQINLSWGVLPVLLKEEKDTFVLFDHAVREAVNKGYLKEGQRAVITAGVPLGQPGTTNLLKALIV